MFRTYLVMLIDSSFFCQIFGLGCHRFGFNSVVCVRSKESTSVVDQLDPRSVFGF